MDKNPIPRRVLSLALSIAAHKEGRKREASENKSIPNHLPSYSVVIEDLSSHLFTSPNSSLESFFPLKELYLHPPPIPPHTHSFPPKRNNSQIDTVYFLNSHAWLNSGTWPYCLLLSNIPFGLSFCSADCWVKWEQKEADVEWCAYAVLLAGSALERLYLLWGIARLCFAPCQLHWVTWPHKRQTNPF